MHALDKTTGASVWKQDKLAQRRRRSAGRSATVAVVDVEGYLHLSRPQRRRLVGRLATDGSAATAQPAASGDDVVWQSRRRDAVRGHARR